MQARDIKTVADALALIEQRGMSHVKVAVTDIDGILRGKYLSREKFAAVLQSGLSFCDVVLGWDMHDQLYDNVQFTGWHTAYPDAQVKLLPHTARDLPFEPGGDDDMLFFLGEFTGKAAAICPRRVLHRVLAKAEAMGFDAMAALEYEFFMFRETPESVRAKNYRNLETWTPGYFGYSILRSTVNADFYQELLDLCERMDMPIEGLHTETGPGVLEAALNYDEAGAMADKAILFKTFVKVLAQKHGLMATFMAKWSHDYPGQSGHIHLSLRNRHDHSPVFYDASQPHGMSQTQRHFMAGIQRLLPELMAMYAQTVNSYTRLVPGYWAPLDATWGMENRTTALRLIPGSAKSQRVEVRIGSADANPYLALAAALGSGLEGIEHQWEPEPMVEGNAYTQKFAPHLALPGSLWDAAQRLKQSASAAKLFGDAFVEHYAATREWEERQFRRHVTDWELARYFEII